MAGDLDSSLPADPAGPPPVSGKGRFRAAFRRAVPSDRFGDHVVLLSGTGQNIVGLVVFVLASFATNVLISRAFGPRGPSVLGIVTLATQFAFVAGAATRFGMDMAAVRRVAIDVSTGKAGQVRGVMALAAQIAGLTSLIGAALVFVAAGPLVRAFVPEAGSSFVFQATALAIPFVALCQVYLGGTRGLKIMRHTLWIYWAGQPIAWIALMLFAWSVAKTTGATVLAYSLSWLLATVAAWWVWERETAAFGRLAPDPGERRALIRYGTPRAPAALLSQLLFWTDYFVAARYVSSAELGIYAAAVRLAQALMLFLIAVNYMFSPFVAELHAAGQRDRLDGLYKSLTRWVLAGTLPLMLLLLIRPGPVLQIFGSKFGSGTTALRILLIGQLVNVAVGSVGFILIMVGRTGWDLVVYAASFAIDLTVAFILAPRFGAEGAAVAQTVTMVVSNAARLYLVWRFVHIQPFSRHYVRLIVPAAAGAAAMLGMRSLTMHSGWPVALVATGLVGSVVYGAALLLGGLSPAERRALARFIGRSPAA